MSQGKELLHLDDLQVGQVFTSRSQSLDAADIKRFAGEFDPQPFHTDEEAARSTFFGGLAASGWHTAALTMRLMVDGGVLHAVSEVLEIVPSRTRADRGMVTVRSETKNQDGEVVQRFTGKLVVPRRSA